MTDQPIDFEKLRNVQHYSFSLENGVRIPTNEGFVLAEDYAAALLAADTLRAENARIKTTNASYGVVVDELQARALSAEAARDAVREKVQALCDEIAAAKNKSPRHHPYNKGRCDGARWMIKKLRALIGPV